MGGLLQWPMSEGWGAEQRNSGGFWRERQQNLLRERQRERASPDGAKALVLSEWKDTVAIS